MTDLLPIRDLPRSMIRPHIKICGLKTEGHIDTVLARGCSEVGFVHFERSPRHLSIEDMIRLRAHVGGRALVTVVTVDADDEFLKRLAARVRPDVIQLHGSETAARVAAVQALTGAAVMKAISVSTLEDLAAVARFRPFVDRILLDAKRPKGSALPGGNGCSRSTIDTPMSPGWCRPSKPPAALLNHCTRWLLRSTTTTASGSACAAAR